MSHHLEPGTIGSVLPAGVFCADISDLGQAVTLRDAERTLVRSSGGKRLRDFTLGRDCAHRALRRLGAPAIAILAYDNGAPLWQPGIVGSITHTGGYAAAAVAPAASFLGIGIDAERVEVLDTAVERRLFAPEELAGLDGLPSATRAVAAMTLFSAKEACFKAWPPDLAPRSFHAVRVTPGDGDFLVSAGPLVAHGRAMLSGGMVVTAVTLPAA